MSKFDRWRLGEAIEYWRGNGRTARNINFLIFCGALLALPIVSAYEMLRSQHKKDVIDTQRQQMIAQINKELDEEEDELSFVQLIELGDDCVLLIKEYKYCPDLTAFIQVATKDSISKIYKRKVLHKGAYQKYINFNGRQVTLDVDKIKVKETI